VIDQGEVGEFEEFLETDSGVAQHLDYGPGPEGVVFFGVQVVEFAGGEVFDQCVCGSDVLGAGTTALGSPETAETAILPTSTPLLDVLPSGPIPPNPAELLNSRAFTDLLSQLARRYDRIILDSAPVLAAADSRIISALGAATILVVKCGSTRVKVVERACESLRGVGGNVVGLVLNRVPRSSDEYYDYGGYTAVQYRLYDPEAMGRNGNGNGKKITVNLPENTRQ